MAYGVTAEMIAAYGELIFDLSLNRQSRIGDPVRTLDMAAIEAQRDAAGLSDAEIAARLGLTVEQTRFIRVVSERRRFRTDQYRKLFGLGAGKRWREDRYKDRRAAQQLSKPAMELRAALRFDPGRVRKFIDAGWWRDETLSGWLRDHAARAPDRPAILAETGAISYGALADRAARLAGGLAGLGIGRGDVVAVQLANSVDFITSYLGVAGLGAVMTPVHMPYRAAEIATQLGHSGARAIICAGDGEGFHAGEVVLGLKASLGLLDHVICTGEPPPGALSLSELISGARPLDAAVEPVAADPFLLLYTSGTTGGPKAVPLSYQMMLGNARLSAPDFNMTAGDMVLSAAPYSHLFGLYSLHLALHAGAAVVPLAAPTPQGLATVMAGAGPSLLFAAPAHIAACSAQGLLATPGFAKLRLAIISGSPLTAGLAGALDKAMTEGDLVQLWGMTETQAALYTRPGDPVGIAATSAGRPSPGTEVRISDANGGEGELLVRGPSVCAGYFKNDDANARRFTADGWFRSGDLATMDAQGNVSLTGRCKDIINRGGVKFNPAEIEALMERHPKIDRAAIIPMPDPLLGEKACCFVVARPGAEITLEEICDHLLGCDIAKIKLPERLEVIAGMPLTATGKIVKGRLKPKGGW